MVANSTASGTAQSRPKVGVTSAGQVMVAEAIAGAAEVAPGATPARGAAAGAGVNSLFLAA